MLQSSMKNYDEIIFGFGFVIYDECHHSEAEVFSKALLKTNFKYLSVISHTKKDYQRYLNRTHCLFYKKTRRKC